MNCGEINHAHKYSLPAIFSKMITTIPSMTCRYEMEERWRSAGIIVSGNMVSAVGGTVAQQAWIE